MSSEKDFRLVRGPLRFNLTQIDNHVSYVYAKGFGLWGIVLNVCEFAK